MKDTYELHAAKLLRESNEGVLSTISKKFDGYPFGSFTTFTTDRDRSIIIYVSDLAQHTKNLKNDSKASLTIYNLNKKGDQQDSQRLTLLGDLKLADNQEDCKKRFSLFLPHSANYHKMHDFSFYTLEINQARWIGGFGQIAWLKTANWIKNSPKWLERENSIIEHMNEDHSNSIVSTLNAQLDIKDPEAKMIALNTDGYYVSTRGKIRFLTFMTCCLNMKQYKDELVRQAHDYREYEL
tara:strand:- start:352 stop:1068 length:717 start_codon:yes stop_codon:yes gene_type:complete